MYQDPRVRKYDVIMYNVTTLIPYALKMVPNATLHCSISSIFKQRCKIRIQAYVTLNWDMYTNKVT